MYTSWFLISPYNALGSTTKKAINQSIPTEFIDLMQFKGVDVQLIYQQRSIAEIKVYLLPEGYRVNLGQALQNMGIKLQYVKYLSETFAKGIPSFTYTISCNEYLQKQLGCFADEAILTSTLDLDNLTLTLDFSESSYQSVTSTNNTTVKMSSISALSSSFNYNLNVSQGFGKLATDAYALSLTNVSSFENTHLSSGLYVGSSDGKSEFEIDNLQLIHDLERSSVALSYGGGLLGAGGLSQMNYAYPGDVITASWYSNSSINSEENYVSLRPIDIFVARSSTAQVYKDGRLINIQMLNPGVQKLDTSSFPSGIYQIRIDIYEGSELVKQYHELIEKPFSISGIDNQLGFAFALWSGLAAKIDQSDNFDQIYIGGSIAKALNKYWLSKASFYQAGSLSVLEIDNEFLLPYDVALIANAGIDDDLGYGLSLSVNKSFNNLISMSLSYSQNNGERENSPFSTKSQLLGINTSLNLLDWGNLYLGISYNFDNNSSYYTSYNHPLYDHYGLTVDFTTGLNWSGTGALQPNTYHTYDYYFALNITYRLDDGARVGLSSQYTPKSNTFSSGANYSSAADSMLWLDSVDIGYAHGNDSNSYNAGVSLNYDYLSGNISAYADDSKTQGSSQNISASLSGSFAYAANNLILLESHSGSTGVAFELDSNDTAQMQLMINDTLYPVHSGVNFIALTPYQSYTLQLLRDGNRYESVAWDQSSEEFTLYPGNIYYSQRQLIPVTQVYGQLINEHSEIMGFAKVSSGVATEYSDESGYFTLEVALNDQVLVVETEHTLCSVPLSATKQENVGEHAIWLGALSCNTQQ